MAVGKKSKGEKGKPLEDDASIHDEDLDMDDSPPVIDPYEVLGLEKEASADDVKKAYRKQALQHHPDKAPDGEKDVAKQKFQGIAFAYAVLSDDRRRKRYDLTGSTAESIEDEEDFDWLSFYREQFEDVVNEDNINRIANEYKGSAEERRDLLRAYTDRKGRLDDVYARVMLSDILVDDDRFRKIIDEEIAKGSIESFTAYERINNDTARQKAKDAEQARRDAFDKQQAKEAAASKSNGNANGKAKPKKKSGAGDLGDLAALIQQRQKARSGNFFDHLEAKYAAPSRGGKRSTPMDEPPEEAFEEMAARKNSRASGRPTKAAALEDDDEEDINDDEDDEEEESTRPAKKQRKTSSKKSRKTRV